MTGSTEVQRCPFCGVAPMSRLQYLLVPGTRSKCRRCGGAIRVRLTRGQMVIILLGAVATGGLIAAFAESALALTASLVLALVLALALDQWAWRHIPWVPDAQPAASEPSVETRPLETADH